MRVRADAVFNHETIPIWVRDVSAGGANLSSPQEIPADMHFDLLLSEHEKIGCIVCHCRQKAANIYSIGAKFTEDISQRTIRRRSF
jgi:hypothetical protein